MPQLAGVLETSLYVEDLERSIRFYQEVMQFQKLVGDERFCALQAAERQVLHLEQVHVLVVHLGDQVAILQPRRRVEVGAGAGGNPERD